MALTERISAIAQFLQREDDELLDYEPDSDKILYPIEASPITERVNAFYECGCCSAYHRIDFRGDCRDDNERILDLPDDAVIVDIDEVNQSYADFVTNAWSVIAPIFIRKLGAAAVLLGDNEPEIDDVSDGENSLQVSVGNITLMATMTEESWRESGEAGGLGILIEAWDENSEPMFEYAPANFTPEIWTTSIEELAERADAFDPSIATRVPVHNYDIVVGNIGTVYSGTDRAQAKTAFDTYLAQSKANSGRAAGESVAWMVDGEERQGYIGTNAHDNDEDYRNGRSNLQSCA